MPKNQRGVAHAMVLLVAIILAVAGGTGYYVWRRNHQMRADGPTAASNTNSSDTYKVGLVTFKHASQFSSSLRQEILTKVADPLVYYENTDLKVNLTSVVIDLGLSSDNKMRSAKYGYILSEIRPTDNKSGFAFGENGNIDYWFSSLCDDGGCRSYPADFKNKYPANYQAYLNSQPARKSTQ